LRAPRQRTMPLRSRKAARRPGGSWPCVKAARQRREHVWHRG
jgi:hypothetical protein